MSDVISITAQQLQVIRERIYDLHLPQNIYRKYDENPLNKFTLNFTFVDGGTSKFFYEYNEKTKLLTVSHDRFSISEEFVEFTDKGDSVKVQPYINWVKDNTIMKWLTTEHEKTLDANTDPMSVHEKMITNQSMLLYVYWDIQFVLRNLPSVFIKSTSQKVKKIGNNKVSKNKHRIKLINHYRINEKTLAKKSTFKISCPAWGVRGHYRLNPATGKRDIWVKPYIKGKERHNPSKYVEKEYVYDI